MEWLRLSLDDGPVYAVVVRFMSHGGIGEGKRNVVEHHDRGNAMIPNQTPKITAKQKMFNMTKVIFNTSFKHHV